MNRLTINDTIQRRERPADLTGHADQGLAEELQRAAAEYGIWAMPQAGGSWGLLPDGEREDWTWQCRDLEDARAVLLRLIAVVRAMDALLEQHEALHDLLRAPGGTPYDDGAEGAEGDGDGGGP